MDEVGKNEGRGARKRCLSQSNKSNGQVHPGSNAGNKAHMTRHTVYIYLSTVECCCGPWVLHILVAF